LIYNANLCGSATPGTTEAVFQPTSLSKLKPKKMAVEILTKEDLAKFKAELIEDLKKVINGGSLENKKWLKSYEVMKLLKISPGTLQNMRIKGKLPYTKIGGVIYYGYEDIQKMLETNKQNF
jgi:predicted site-specific integrase-resolvase